MKSSGVEKAAVRAVLSNGRALLLGGGSLIGATSAIAFSAFFAAPASAACVQTFQQGVGETITCSGVVTPPVVYDDISVTTIGSLTAAPNPPTGTAIAIITNAGGPVGGGQQGAIGIAGQLGYSDASYGFATVDASGLAMIVAGGDGGDGSGESNGVGASGGAGGAGQAATISVTAPTVSVTGNDVAAILASSSGGTGGAGSSVTADSNNLTGGASGNGGAGGNAAATATVGSLAINGGATGIKAESLGGSGGSVGPDGQTAGRDNVVGSLGGSGGSAATATATVTLGDVSVVDASGAVVAVRSQGGTGGLGGEAASDSFPDDGIATGGAGGTGGNGGTASVTGSLTLRGTTKPGFVGVLAQSIGGQGGDGGPVSGGAGSVGGKGGAGGAGGDVSVGTAVTPFVLDAELTGDQTQVVAATSYGGAGGEGGATRNGFGQKGQGGAAAGGGAAGDVSVYMSGSAATAGAASDAIFLQSIGGFSGDGIAFGSGDQSFGQAGNILFSADLAAGSNGFGLSTSGDYSDAVVAQSIGGGGGKSLENVALTALGSTGGGGGDAGSVTVSVTGAPINTTGGFSRGIYADSVGGGGGSGGAATGIATLGAAGGTGGNGGAVSVTTSSAVNTLGNGSDGIFAASRGGGGGSAMSSAGAFKVGGQAGGGGGNGGTVSIDFTNGVSTAGADADGVSAQSIGGGGGDGANAVAGGMIYVQAIGGGGGTGGTGGAVTVSQSDEVQGVVRTLGDRSRGVVAQSIGGGGGQGGSAVAATAIVPAYTHEVGGSGGTGGAGGIVQVDLVAPVTTQGNLADAVFAQSIGGGGGAAGTVIAASVLDVTIAHSVGGSGGSGGSASAVTVSTQGAVSTAGDHSSGVVAAAIAGGGGNSGLVINNSVAGASLGVAVGGRGGAGGSVNGKVSVTAGAVSTQGDASIGISARSVGGGGGHGGTVVTADAANFGTINVDVGGRGGAGGNADDVEVTANGAVSTKGDWASAISAISAGGGGGSGGVVVDANAISALSVGVSIGGNGGAGGDAGAVTVTSYGSLQTTGAMSDGIYAASLGGFGGDAGVGLISATTDNVASLGNIAVAIGGDGGPGGEAGAVNVTSAGGISTSGLLSAGIQAQSIGGGGGRARGVVVGNVVDVGNLTVSVGGNGGAGGKAGDVSVTTTASNTTISTDGAFSHGIVAQSIGGTGGSGGFAGDFSFNVTTPGAGGVAGQFGVTVGGGGAVGGSAGTVTIDNASAIRTGDFGSFGIFAQSIGGHGGDGGNVYAGNVTISQQASINIDVDVGGDGGFGATGNDVEVTNGGAIVTAGQLAPAIVAQAIGGNGGNGGSTYAVLAQYNGDSDGNIQVSVGGAGGGGGKAGSVTVTNNGLLATSGGASDAIYAQSVGGGGGRGGSAGYIGLNLTPPTSATPAKFDVNVNVGAGGSGGEGADGNAVTVDNTGNIQTTGMRSRGIFAQSIGGGGGDGGTASATSFGLSDICNAGVNGSYICPTSNNANQTFQLNSTVQIGGSGGAAGEGGIVNVKNSGNITTRGQLSHGIYAQSVGGGGGNGGEGALGIEAWTTNQIAINVTDLPSNFLPSWSSNDVVVGGKGSAGGNGGAVTVTNSGIITILGPDKSYLAKYTGLSGGVGNALPFLAGGAGIFAQSVGGGGGDGGAGSSSFTALATVGNGGGKGGDGGAVAVGNTGAITNTSGYNGTGIFAQSVGGGGGVAGDVGLALSDSWEKINVGAGLAIVEDAGDGGDGGAVNVTSGGIIRTTGASSIGIFAQSVGGSGGISAVSSQEPNAVRFIGSAGAGGNGGNVAVTNNAAISVEGENSVGIVALSAGGVGASDTSGTVTVSANASISASGKGARAIFASSDSYQNTAQNSGAVAINVAQGATVSTGAEGAETVGIKHAGNDSSLTNLGTIASGNAASYAIRIETENAFDLDNYGTISGSVFAASSDANQQLALYVFDNYGQFNTGSVVTLEGIGSIFSSQGTISPGGAGVLQKTAISANYGVLLMGTNIYQADFDPSQVVSGSVVASDGLTLSSGGGVTVLGSVSPNVVLSNPGNALRSGSAYILDTAATFDASSLGVANTPTVQYSLSQSSTVQPGTNTLVLSYDIDTTPWSGSGWDLIPADARRRVNSNHESIGAYVDSLVFGGAASGSGQFAGVLGASVLNTKTFDELLDIYDGYVADEALAVQDATYLSTLMFSDELFSCSRRNDSGALVFDEQGQCAWARFYGNAIDMRQSREGPSYTEAVAGVSLGAQFELSPDTFLGAATAWEIGRLDLDAGQADVSRYFSGLSLKRDFGPLTLAGSLEAGFFGFDLARNLFNGTETLTAKSESEGYNLAAHVRASNRFDLGGLFVEPVLDAGVTWLRQNAFSETGAGDFGVSVSALEQTIYSVNPYVNFGGTLTLGEMASQFELRAGVLALAGDDASVDTAFLGTGPNGPTFSVESRRSDLFADIGAGIEMQVSDKLSIRGEFDALIARDQFAVGGRLRLNQSF